MPEFAVFHHPDMLQHETGPDHPERPERLGAIIESLKAADLGGLRWRPSEPANRAHLELVHKPDYITAIEALSGRSALLCEDTPISPESVQAARLAAGAAVGAMNAVMTREVDSAIALVRPPGHHASTAQPMGFCLFNNIAVAAQAALQSHGLERVLILDWDVHHGNGTQEIFYPRKDVLFIDLHEDSFWPGTGGLDEVGTGDGEGYTLNFPIPRDTGNDVYLGILASIVTPIARSYCPQLILISAGFDAHQDDPLGEMNVTPEGFAGMCAIMRNLASELCDGRIAFILEGGYGLRGLADSVLACAHVLNEDEPAGAQPEALAPASELARFAEHHAKYWPL